MDWSGLSRHQIEAELLGRMEAARARYNALRGSAGVVEGVIRDAVGSDGSLCVHQARGIAREVLEAFIAYKLAVKQFTDFVVGGQMPPRV